MVLIKTLFSKQQERVVLFNFGMCFLDIAGTRDTVKLKQHKINKMMGHHTFQIHSRLSAPYVKYGFGGKNFYSFQLLQIEKVFIKYSCRKLQLLFHCSKKLILDHFCRLRGKAEFFHSIMGLFCYYQLACFILISSIHYKRYN